MHVNINRRGLLCVPLLMVPPSQAVAQQDPCSNYYGRGYCTDYVNQRTGVRQRGDARTWPSNISRIDVQPGDVAIFRRQNHVAYVEAVLERGTRVPYAPNTYPTRLRVSEMNFPGPWDSRVPRECLVTVNFGRVGTREGSFNEAEFMRPRRR